MNKAGNVNAALTHEGRSEGKTEDTMSCFLPVYDGPCAADTDGIMCSTTDVAKSDRVSVRRNDAASIGSSGRSSKSSKRSSSQNCNVEYITTNDVASKPSKKGDVTQKRPSFDPNDFMAYYNEVETKVNPLYSGGRDEALLECTSSGIETDIDVTLDVAVATVDVAVAVVIHDFRNNIIIEEASTDTEPRPDLQSRLQPTCTCSYLDTHENNNCYYGDVSSFQESELTMSFCEEVDDGAGRVEDDFAPYLLDDVPYLEMERRMPSNKINVEVRRNNCQETHTLRKLIKSLLPKVPQRDTKKKQSANNPVNHGASAHKQEPVSSSLHNFSYRDSKMSGRQIEDQLRDYEVASTGNSHSTTKKSNNKNKKIHHLLSRRHNKH